jgi:hypothetical protein
MGRIVREAGASGRVTAGPNTAGNLPACRVRTQKEGSPALAGLPPVIIRSHSNHRASSPLRQET